MLYRMNLSVLEVHDERVSVTKPLTRHFLPGQTAMSIGNLNSKSKCGQPFVVIIIVAFFGFFAYLANYPLL